MEPISQVLQSGLGQVGKTLPQIKPIVVFSGTLPSGLAYSCLSLEFQHHYRRKDAIEECEKQPKAGAPQLATHYLQEQNRSIKPSQQTESKAKADCYFLLQIFE